MVATRKRGVGASATLVFATTNSARSLPMLTRPPEPRRRTNGRQRPPEADLDVRRLLRALQAVRDGDFSVRLPGDQTGLAGKVADTFNEIVAANQRIPPATARP